MKIPKETYSRYIKQKKYIYALAKTFNQFPEILLKLSKKIMYL